MSEFKIIETQEELDAVVKASLAREREKYADYDQLKTRVTELESENGALKNAAEASKTALSERDSKIADFEKQVAGYEKATLRTRIALANGLPYDLADRLIGDDEAAITADAERLVGMLKPSEPTAPLKDNEPAIEGGNAGIRSMLQELKGE
ncbi:phage scaffold protein [Streptococcus equi subsp. zooepidemicus]|uniref:phage scaffold protein n=1 Tax=Streptococcus equi TaxID=1336 RepID=UPI001E651C4B|nr:phage scaffold protein [Streptococcus equi]MCD3435615.1 phage scaffold protein [Streptococcus equi subsp. zooepidemicus]MCD3438909.1 phage scaffold protein [Streptococcus equi subsp. zooepidemicus]HEL0792528.1 phage scaffold protein [Streptococcus equi subsp. zooepidemicus]